MKTTNNLKTAAKIAATVLAILLVKPVYAGDSAEAEAAAARIATESTMLEKSLIYTAPDAGENMFTLAARIENSMINLERSLIYKAPEEAADGETDPAAVNFNGKIAEMEAALIYSAPTEDNFEYNYEMALVAERIEKAASANETALVYEVPEKGKIFNYNFELALATERIENVAAETEKELGYSVPASGDMFRYNFEVALTAERLGNAALAVEKSLLYNAPETLNMNVTEAALMTVEGKKDNTENVAIAKASF
jgi:hypothetical protein